MRPATAFIVALAAATAGVLAMPRAALAATPPRASACHITGLVRISPTRCPAVHRAGARSSDSLLGAGGLLGSVFGGAFKSVFSKLVSIVNDGAATALRLTASLMGSTTRPALESTWFSATYWRVVSLSTLLTLPFLFAAAVHALLRSDPAMLCRAALGYLPLAMLAVAIAAPLTMLVLSATDEMCTFLAGAAGDSDAAFLARAASDLTNPAAIAADPVVAFVVGLVTVAATLALWIELLIRAIAVDVIVLLLPLFFAAMVWPARRIWAIRAIETLFALILSKLAIVAVLTLGGAALGAAGQGGTSGLTALLTGATLMLLAVLSPWALLRLLPLHEVAAAAAGGLDQARSQAIGGVHDGVRRRLERSPSSPPRSEASPPASTPAPPGLGAQDDPTSALTRLVESGGAVSSLSGRGRLQDRIQPDPIDPIQPVPGGPAGAAAPIGAAPTAPGASADRFADDALAERPPVPAPFDGRPWEQYVLGEAGDEVMQAPRIATPAPDTPPPPATGSERS
jgi:hypothetical protein